MSPGSRLTVGALFERFGIEDLAQNEKRLRLGELAFESGLVIERELRVCRGVDLAVPRSS